VVLSTLRNKNGPGNAAHAAGNTEDSTGKGGVRYTYIGLNWIFGIQPFDENEHEAALLGLSNMQLTDGQQLVEGNLFGGPDVATHAVASEPEVISMKMNNSVIRGNTFWTHVGLAAPRRQRPDRAQQLPLESPGRHTLRGRRTALRQGPPFRVQHRLGHGRQAHAEARTPVPRRLRRRRARHDLERARLRAGPRVRGQPVLPVRQRRWADLRRGELQRPGHRDRAEQLVVACPTPGPNGVTVIGSGNSSLQVSGNQIHPTVAAAGVTLDATGWPTHLEKGAKAPFLTPAMVGKGGTWRPPGWTG
jgi:hypothetical protein